MHLLHVMQRYWPAVGGAERYWQEISERAARDGDSVQVYTTNAQDIELFWEPGRAAIAEGFPAGLAVDLVLAADVVVDGVRDGERPHRAAGGLGRRTVRGAVGGRAPAHADRVEGGASNWNLSLGLTLVGHQVEG